MLPYRYLTIINAALFALFASLAVVLGVVCIMYFFWLESSPRLQSEWHTVKFSTLLFAVLTVLAGTSFLGLLREYRWRWPALAIFVIALAPAARLLENLLR